MDGEGGGNKSAKSKWEERKAGESRMLKGERKGRKKGEEGRRDKEKKDEPRLFIGFIC